MKTLRITASILIVLMLALGFYAYYCKQELNDVREAVAPLEEAITRLTLDNGAKAIIIEEHNSKIKAKEKELDDAHESLAVQYLLTETYKNETESLAVYIKFMQELCDVNGIVYPYYVIN